MSNHRELTCLSVLVCDDVYRDEITKKMAIIGTFNAIRVERLPATHPRMSIVLSLTSGQGSHDVAVALEHEATGTEVVRIERPVTFDSPLAIADIALHLIAVPLTHAGKHWVTVRSGGTILQQRPFEVSVNRKEEKKEEKSPES